MVRSPLARCCIAKSLRGFPSTSIVKIEARAMTKNPLDEQFSEKEAEARFEAALKGALKTPHKPLKKITAKEHKPEKKAAK